MVRSAAPEEAEAADYDDLFHPGLPRPMEDLAASEHSATCRPPHFPSRAVAYVSRGRPGSYPAGVDWGTIIGTVTGAVIGVGATSLTDRSRWRREQAERRNGIKRELYAAYLAAVARSWNEIKAAVLDSDQPWPERARLSSLAYRNGGVYELRYQLSITAPPEIVALSDQTMRGMRELVEKLNTGQTYDSWDELKTDNQEWFDCFNAMRRMMRLELDPEALPLPSSGP